MYGAGYGGATRNIPASQTKTAAVATNGQCSLSPIPLVPGGQLGDGGGYNTCNSDKSDSNTAWLTQKHQPSATRTTASPEVWPRQAAFYVGSSPNTSGDTELYLDSPQAKDKQRKELVDKGECTVISGKSIHNEALWGFDY